jgi:translation initiation factor 3 subunit D
MPGCTTESEIELSIIDSLYFANVAAESTKSGLLERQLGMDALHQASRDHVPFDPSPRTFQSVMASFSLPTINDNPDGAWGPSSSNFPQQFKFKDIPYAPYSKSDKLGRFADWNELVTDNRQTAVGGLPSAQATRGGRTGTRRDGPQAFGTGTASAFATFHVEDDADFSVVDNRAGPARRPGQGSRGKSIARGGAGFGTRGGGRGGRGGATSTRGGAGGQRGGRRGWRDFEKVCTSRF